MSVRILSGALLFWLTPSCALSTSPSSDDERDRETHAEAAESAVTTPTYQFTVFGVKSFTWGGVNIAPSLDATKRSFAVEHRLGHPPATIDPSASYLFFRGADCRNANGSLVTQLDHSWQVELSTAEPLLSEKGTCPAGTTVSGSERMFVRASKMPSRAAPPVMTPQLAIGGTATLSADGLFFSDGTVKELDYPFYVNDCKIVVRAGKSPWNVNLGQLRIEVTPRVSNRAYSVRMSLGNQLTTRSVETEAGATQTFTLNDYRPTSFGFEIKAIAP